MGFYKVQDINGLLHTIEYAPRIETVTVDTTIDKTWLNGIINIATDAKTLTLADSCPIGMKLKVVNTGADGAVLVTIVGSATVGIGGRNQVLAGDSTILTKAVGKELQGTKVTAIKYDYAILEKISATEWDAETHGIWTKEA